MRLWQIAALLVAGLAVGVVFPGRLTDIFGAVTLNVFLPALIFEAAWSLDAREMRVAWKPIALLAVPGVIVTAAVVALCARVLGKLSWPAALVLGAVLSATDPVAVVALFRRLPVPRRLATIVESEALLNDAVAVVCYRAILAGALGAALVPAIGMALAGIVVATALGIALAWAAALALRPLLHPLAQVVATIAGAYATYMIAERGGWSGIFGVIAFGVTLRALERRRASVQAAHVVSVFWTRAATAANVVLFFLVGAAFDFAVVGHAAAAAGAAVLAVVAARFAVAYGLLAVVRGQLKPAWQNVVRMAGVRGALSLALALATPAAIAGRGAIIDATFVVVVATILVGSLTFGPRLRRLGFTPVP